jgi:enoyl-CoA hydratase/carnithine racemase
MNSNLQIEFQDGLLRFNLNRPDRGNALSLEVARALEKSIVQYSKQKVRGILFQSSGNFFCAGGDLRTYAEQKPLSKGLVINRQIRKALAVLAAIPVPTCVLVQGDCLGGGLELVSAFDHVVTVPEAAFGFWQRRIGVTYGWGGAERLAQKIGEARVVNLGIEARSLSAYEAATVGIVDEVVPSWRLNERGEQWLMRQIALPQKSFQAIKSARTKSSFVRDEVKIFEKLWGKDEHKAVLDRFKKK